jgi:hypothetical protein
VGIGFGDGFHADKGTPDWGGANQRADNSASSAAANASATNQHANQSQDANSASGPDGGGKFATGGGGNVTPQAQDLVQLAKTQQGSISAALAGEFATNGASPVSIGG